MAMLRRPATGRPGGGPGIGIAYDVAGAGPALLLTHGYGATRDMFVANLPALAAGHRVVTWDVRGHGGSDSPPDPTLYTAAASVGDMLALLDHLGIDRATVGGHSLGGYLSLRFTLAHPDRVAKLVLIDTGPGYRREEGRAPWNRLAERYAADLEARGLDGVPTGEELGGRAHRSALGLILAARGILTQHDSHVIEGLTSISVPTLVIVGGDDTGFLGGSSYMADKIPGGRLVTIAGAGHAPNLSHRDDFDREVLTLLDGPG